MFGGESSDDTPVCPLCGSVLKYRDSKLCIRGKEDGRKEHLMIRLQSADSNRRLCGASQLNLWQLKSANTV